MFDFVPQLKNIHVHLTNDGFNLFLLVEGRIRALACSLGTNRDFKPSNTQNYLFDDLYVCPL